MKKLSIVAALALVTTISGVYAAWTYAGGENAKQAVGEKGLTITQGVESGASGMLAISTPTVMKLDDVGSLNTDDALPNYTPGWSSDSAGEFVFTFTPSVGAGVTVLQYTITISNNTYADEDGTVSIFNVTDADPAKEGVQVVGTFTYKPDEAGSNIRTISLNEWQNTLLPINQSYTVGTYAEYEVYAGIVNNINIHVTLEDITE